MLFYHKDIFNWNVLTSHKWIVADMLAVLIKRAKNDGQINGIISHLVDDGLSILQYADDTILFMDHDMERRKTWNYCYVPLNNCPV